MFVLTIWCGGLRREELRILDRFSAVLDDWRWFSSQRVEARA